MEEVLQNIDIRRFKTLFPSALNAELGDDFFIATLDLEPGKLHMTYPLRLDGYVTLFCVEGSIDVSINLNTITLGEKTFVVNVPGNILQISGNDSDRNVQMFIIAMSREFFTSIHLDFNKMFNDSMSLLEQPCFTLTESQMTFFMQYQKLAGDLLSSDIGYKKEIIGSMVSSVFYMFGAIMSERLIQARETQVTPSTRARLIFDQFLNDVKEYHTRERGVGFYADRFCLTPKYLSKLIKEVSGRSAPDWINSFVILEAKNLLKFSDMTIKEIVYKLNFPNESVFYKFFKSHTGYAPSEYRNL